MPGTQARPASGSGSPPRERDPEARGPRCCRSGRAEDLRLPRAGISRTAGVTRAEALRMRSSLVWEGLRPPLSVLLTVLSPSISLSSSLCLCLLLSLSSSSLPHSHYSSAAPTPLFISVSLP